MPTLTPGFSLPYPNGLDAPCDFAEQWCAFSDAFQTALDGFQATIDRTNPAIPIARMERSTPLTMASLDPIIFESLTVDTANWVDFDADPTEIVIDRGGIFSIVANAVVVAVSGGNDYILTVSVSAAAASSFSDQRGAIAAGFDVGLNTASLVTVTVPTTITMRVSVDTLVPLTINRACLTVFWHADRTAP